MINNALKFTDSGFVTLDSKYEEGKVIIKVSDSGIGIAKNNLEKIFSSFEQADTSITRRFGGTGLGLAITKKICELLGGSISVKSELGKGTQFTVVLPMEPGKVESSPNLCVNSFPNFQPAF